MCDETAQEKGKTVLLRDLSYLSSVMVLQGFSDCFYKGSKGLELRGLRV